MQIYKDQIGNNIQLASYPKRIISLVPSQTELLYDLGLRDEVIGITKFCIHPSHWRREKTIIGGTKQVKIDLVKKLSPDLIIANMEENDKDQVNELSKLFTVWTSNIHNREEALQMIASLGTITGKNKIALSIIDDIRKEFTLLQNKIQVSRNNPLKVGYLIWREPYMIAGGDTFISDMISACGCLNAFSKKMRYPEITMQELNNCDLILFSSEPYPFKEKHISELQQSFRLVNFDLKLPMIKLVDGEMFSWYGSRMKKAPTYFASILKNV